VREFPRPIRHKKERVANRTDNVIDQITGAESTMAALVSDDPNSGEDAALAQPVGGVAAVEHESSVEERAGKVENATAERRGCTIEPKQRDGTTFAPEC
jgi:hypothetical protein